MAIYQGVSIVDYLKSVGQPSDFASRKIFAQQQGISNYTGSAQQNTQLLNTLKSGTIIPTTTQTTTPREIPVVGQPGVPQVASTTTPTETSGTGDPQLDGVLQIVQTMIDTMKQKGQMINPKVEITPERVAEFMSTTSSNLDTFLDRKSVV